jgi:hypothetical protein
MKKAEYIISTDGHIMQNEAGVALAQVIREVKEEETRFDATYVGALLANVFLENPWLASFTLSLIVSYEYDDEGGNYKCIDTNVRDVSSMPGIETEFLDEDGKFLPHEAENYLEELLEDGHSIYPNFQPDTSDCAIDLLCERSAIAELLLAKPISGAEAFAKMFSDRAAFLGIGGCRGQ